jgi:hypothetical protein
VGSLRKLLNRKKIVERFGNRVGDRVLDMGSDVGDILVWKQNYQGKSVFVHLRSTELHFGMVWVDIIAPKNRRQNEASFDIIETWLLEKPKFSNPENTQWEELEILKRWAKLGGLRFLGVGLDEGGWERIK